MREFWRTAFQRHIIVNAFRIALVVGTVLNLINQGSALWSRSDISWVHILLNYIVPYCVATYSAATNDINRRKIGDR